MIRYNKLLIPVLIALILVSGCGFGGITPDANTPGTSAPTSVSADGVVTIGFAAQEFERSTYEPLIEQFNQANPDIRVRFVSTDELNQNNSSQTFDPNQMMRQLVSAADTGSAFFVRPEDIRNGYLRDLRPLMDADPNFDINDYYPITLGGVSDGNSVYALPRTMRIQLLSYNKALWDASGLPAPDPNWSWNDLMGAAAQLARKNGTTVETYGLVDGSNGFLALLGELDAAGVNIFATPAEQARLDTPEIEAALNRVVSLAESGALYMPSNQAADGSVQVFDTNLFNQLITEQRVAIWLRDMGGISFGDGSAPDLEIGVAAFPDLSLPFFINSSQSYVMSSGTQHPQEAWRWLEFLSRQQLQQPFVTVDSSQISEIPARKSVAEASGYWSNLDEETAAVVRAVLDRPSSLPPSGIFDARVSIFEPLNQALTAVLTGGKAADEALREAQASLDEQVAKVQLTPQPTPDTAPIVVSTPVANVAPEGSTQITFSSVGFDPSLFRRIAREFNQNNPDIFVNVQDANSFDSAQNLTDIAAASDCFFWWGMPQQEEITATLDLQPLIDADAAFDIDDYPPALLDLFRQNNALYGLPFTVNFRVLNYNRDAFDAAGISYPDRNWTLEDLMAAAQQLTSGSGDEKRYGFASFGSQTEDLIFILEQFGVRPSQGSADAVQPNFTDPALLDALNFYVRLVRETSPDTQLNGYKPQEMFSNNTFQLLSDGRVGMWFDSGFFGFNSDSFTMAVAPPPLQSSVSASSLNATGLYISASSEQPAACWTWLKYLSSSPTAYNSGFPARISVTESPEYAAAARSGVAEVYQAYRAALDGNSANSSGEPFSFYSSMIDYFWFFRAIDRAIQGGDLQRELEDAQRLTEEFLDCVRGGADASTCAPQVDSTYEGFNRSSTEGP